MSLTGRARMWLRAITTRSRFDREMREEIDAHVAQATARFMARGMTEVEARQAAQREFGHRGSIEQSGREARGAQWISGIGEDVRHAMRYFGRTPLASVTIVLTLALGIGFSSAGFSVLDGMLFRPAPGVPDDPALVKIRGRLNVRPYTRKFSWEELNSHASLTNIFATVAAWSATSVVIDAGDPERGATSAHALFVTPNYFTTLRTPLLAGRVFGQSRFDQLSPPELTAVISHTFAQQLVGIDAAAAAGKAISVNGMPVTIIGVTEPRFNGAIQSGESRMIWLPLSAWETLTRDRRIFSDPGLAMFEAVARLQPGVSTREALPAVRMAAARARTDVITPELPGERRVYAGSAGAPANRLATADVARLRGMVEVSGPYRNQIAPGILWVSLVAILILLVCTTTVNSLLLGAAVSRRYEIGVRLALGASRWRVVRQLLTEIGILALAGGLLGMYVFGSMLRIVEVAQDGFDVTPNGTTIAFTVLYALFTASLCGLSPALHATRTALAEVLKESAVTTTSRSRLQRMFVVAQIAIAQPLMVSLGAALSFLAQDLRQSPHAALRERLMVASLDTWSGDNATRPDPMPRLIERMRALGGVLSVMPRTSSVDLRISARTDSTAIVRSELTYVVPGFFDAVDAPIIVGRDFVASDSTLEVPPLILSEVLARQLYPSPSGAVGQRVRALTWPDDQTMEMEIVGVARTGQGGAFREYESDFPLAFAPLRRSRAGMLLIRTSGPAETVMPQVRATILQEAPSFPLTRLSTLSRHDAQRRQELVKAGGAGLGSGAMALLLAAVGLYAMLSVAVGQRRREIGVRVAIGARHSQVVGMFFMSGLRTALVGIALGLPFSVIALRMVGSELDMPGSQVLLVALVIIAALIAVASFASWLPARRAARVHPSVVLRSE